MGRFCIRGQRLLPCMPTCVYDLGLAEASGGVWRQDLNEGILSFLTEERKLFTKRLCALARQKAFPTIWSPFICPVR